MKATLVILAVGLAMALAWPENQSGGNRPPAPDCPDLKTKISEKCPDRSKKDCFKCVFNGCGPNNTDSVPTCEAITKCVSDNILKC